MAFGNALDKNVLHTSFGMNCTRQSIDVVH